MPSHFKKLVKSASDDDLLDALTAELQRLLPPAIQANYPELVAAIQRLPIGLRSMAATHRLDVSMSLDDLGWHFYNFHDRAYAEETLAGLLELEAAEVADIFQSAYDLVSPQWEEIGKFDSRSGDAFAKWYSKSALNKALDPLNLRLWAICNEQPNGLMQFWLDYARKYPERLQ